MKPEQKTRQYALYAILLAGLMLSGGLGIGKGLAQTSAHFVWKKGNWGQIVMEQNDVAQWIAIDTGDFVNMDMPANNLHTDTTQTPLPATDNFSFTPRQRQNSTQAVQYTTTLPYSKGTQLRAGLQYTQRQSSLLTKAQDAGFGVQLRNGKFQISSLYLQRAQQDEYSAGDNNQAYNMQVYNLTASYQLTPRVRLGFGYNVGAVSQDGNGVNANFGEHNYENLILGATTRFALGRTGVNLGYVFQHGGDKIRPADTSSGDSYTGLLFNLNF